MDIRISKYELKEYLGKQLDCFFPDKYSFQGNDIDRAFELALEKLENCFKYIIFPAYSNALGQTFFNHLHADQYAQFLYFFSNCLWKISQNSPICDKVIYLNRAINGFYFSYKCELPDIFFFDHPVGSIIGNASYHDYLVVMQGVTINTAQDKNGETAPYLGKGLYLATGASVIGNKRIGDRVSIGVNATAYNKEIADDNVVVLDEESGKTIIRRRKKEYCKAQDCFRSSI